MATVSGQILAPFRHESHRLAMLPGDLLHAVLVYAVPVGHLQRLRIAQIDFRLTRPPFALGELHGNTGPFHAVADGPDQPFLLGCLKDVVVLDIPARRLEVGIALAGDIRVAFVEEIEFQLGADLDRIARVARPRQLAFQDRARRVRNVLAVMIHAIADDQGGAFQPGDVPQGRRIRPDGEIAIPLVPRGGLEARYRLHFHIHGQQVIADMHLTLHLVEVEAARHPFAQEAPLHVRKTDQNRIDLPLVDQSLQGFPIQHSRHGFPPPLRASLQTAAILS